jgi:hypothetical protein
LVQESLQAEKNKWHKATNYLRLVEQNYVIQERGHFSETIDEYLWIQECWHILICMILNNGEKNG